MPKTVERKQQAILKKYDGFLYKAKTASMERLTAKDLRQTARETGDSATGLDQWAPGDMKFLSEIALEALAEFLNMVEEGAEWFEQLQVARAVFLSTKTRKKDWTH